MRSARLIVVLAGVVGMRGIASAEPAVGLVAPASLASFDTASPAGVAVKAITGLAAAAGETVVGIDVRPATGRLVAVTVDAANVTRTYTVDTDTAAATSVGQLGSPVLSNAALFGIDFNPRVDRLRVVDSAVHNFRINPDTGALTASDTNLTFNVPATGPVVAVAYDRNTPGTSVVTLTTLYGIDRGSSRLVTVGGIDGTPSPNGGIVSSVGTLGVTLDVGSDAGFDIAASGTAFATLRVAATTGLYTINLGTGAATLIGALPLDVKDVAVLAAVPTTTTTTLPPTCDPSCGAGNDPCTIETCVAGTCVGDPLTGFASATCACDRTAPAACAGLLIPAKITRAAAKACTLLNRAGDASAGRRKKLLGKTIGRWGGVARLVKGRAGKRLATECRGALADQYRDAADRVRQVASGS